MKYVGHSIVHEKSYEIYIYDHKRQKGTRNHSTHGVQRHWNLLAYVWSSFMSKCVEQKIKKQKYWISICFPLLLKPCFTSERLFRITWDDNACHLLLTWGGPVTQPCHLVELWRFTFRLVIRNHPDNYLPHLGRCFLCNISLRCHWNTLLAKDGSTLTSFGQQEPQRRKSILYVFFVTVFWLTYVWYA